jgi:hypothetical protein
MISQGKTTNERKLSLGTFLATAAFACACERGKNTEQEGTQAVAVSRSASSASSPPRDGATVAKVAQSCAKICEFSRTLECKNARDCEPNCLAMGALRGCLEPVAALYSCLTSHPVAHWECAEDGVAAIREGYCEGEQERAVGCMERNLTQ